MSYYWTTPVPGFHACGFMRVQKYPKGWRAWDVLDCPHVRPRYPTTFHRTKREAQAHVELIMFHHEHSEKEHK